MKKNKRLLSLILLLVIGGAVGCWCFRSSEGGYRLEVMQVGEGGYGYKILSGKRTIIVQPFIPVIAGKKSFHTKEDAQQVGNLVLQRIKAGEDFAISRADLKSLEIY